MAPDAEDCESARLNEYHVPIHSGRRVLPSQAEPARAWTEAEDLGDKSPGDNRRLLPAHHDTEHKSSLRAGLTLGVHSAYPHKPSVEYQKSRFQKRKEKLIEALKPPYFILSMIIIMVGIHTMGSESVRARLEWLPVATGAWWREPWRLLTYGFVHASSSHLALNALVALTVGWRLEREQTWCGVCAVWGGGLGAGALAAGALQPAVKVVGSSAAVFALLLAHLPNVCLRFGHIPLWWFRPLSVVVLCASEGCWALVRAAGGEGRDAGGEHVAWSAHVLGAAVGVPLAFVVFTGENINKTHVMAARIVSALVLLSGLIFPVVYYTVWVDAT